MRNVENGDTCFAACPAFAEAINYDMEDQKCECLMDFGNEQLEIAEDREDYVWVKCTNSQKGL